MGPTKRWQAAALVALLTALAPAVASADDDAFKKGLDARGQKKWTEAADQMRKAIQADGNESTRKVRGGFLGAFGGGGTEYLPFYFLGEALKNLGDCAGAVAAWETSEDQKAIMARPDFGGSLRAGYKECAGKGVLLRNDFRERASSADQAYKEASDAAERIASVRTSNPDLWRPENDATYDRARNELTTAQAHLAKARQSRLDSDFAESRDASTRANGLLRPIETRLNASLGKIVMAQSRLKEVQQLVSEAEETDRAIDATRVILSAPLAASRESARETLARTRQQLGQPDKLSDPALVDQVAAIARDMSKALGAILDETRKTARGRVEEQLQAAVTGATQEFSFVQASLGRLDQLATEKPQSNRPDMVRQRELLQEDVSAARRQFASAQRSGSISGLHEATRLATEARMRLDALIKQFGSATLRDRGVAAPLEEGARNYFDGQYQKAIDVLGPPGGLGDIPLQVHVHLFRAASYYALYLQSGEVNQAMRANAAADVQKCKAIDAAFQPDPRAFAPAFIRFFENPAPAPGQEASAGQR